MSPFYGFSVAKQFVQGHTASRGAFCFSLLILNVANLFIMELCFELAPNLIIEEDGGMAEGGNA